MERQHTDSVLSARKRELLLLRLKRTAVPRNDIAPPMQRVERNKPLQLSFAQQRLWFVDQLDHSASRAYHMPTAIRLDGRLDKKALKAALDRIVARHEILRTTFQSLDGVPYQVVADAETGFQLLEHEFCALIGEAQEAAVVELSEQEVLRDFDLAAGPLIRGRLVRLADDEHVLLITQHHIVSDWWSVSNIVREISVLYAAFTAGLPDPYEPLPLQYADYAAWQRQWLQGDVLKQQTAFWKDYLANAPGRLTLPLDRPRPETQSFRGGTVEFAISSACSDALRALSQRHGVTLFMTLLTGWAVLLARLAGQDDVVIGTPVANRQREETESLLGFFVNTLALRVNLEGSPSVSELLSRVKQSTVAAFEHQDLPFDVVVEAMLPARSLSHSPLFQVMLNMTTGTDEASLELAGLSVRQLAQPQNSSQFDLSLTVQDSGKELYASLQYASDLFDCHTVERFSGYLQALLVGMAADDDASIARLRLLTTEQRRQLLVDFNDTVTEHPKDMLLHELFEAQVSARPDAIALAFSNQSLSYSELNCRANQVAHCLLGLGVAPDDRVAIFAERSLELVIGLLGVWKAGAAYVPLDPSYPQQRLAYMLQDCEPVALLTQRNLALSLSFNDVPVLYLDDQVSLSANASSNPDAKALGLTPGHLAYVIYTSGSTGLPKGVMVEHKGLCNLAVTQRKLFDVCADSCVLQFASFSFDASISEVAMVLCSGASLHLSTRDSLIPGDSLSALLRERRITHVTLPPSALALMESHVSAETTMIVAGEACPPALARRWADGRRLYNAYGPTEATVCATVHLCSGKHMDSVPIGRPIANTHVYILDGEQEPVPPGVVGELFIGGIGVARGYLNRAELTAERFIANPFSNEPGARMYRTGDLGRWFPDGTIEYCGRSDWQVKIRGFRVELGEIETKLSTCAGVREVVVLAREDRPGEKRLVAYLVVEEGRTLTATSLRAQLAAQLPEHMVPSAFVSLDAFPLTPNGKLDRKALPIPDGSAAATRKYVAPIDELEVAIAGIWKSLLSVDRVGRQDHFFELGGHSLMAVQLMSKLRNELGVELALRELFSHSTLQAFADVVRKAQHTVLSAITPVDRSRVLPLSFSQQRIWFVDKLDRKASAAYLMPAAVRIEGPLKAAALQAALDRLVARHESLRTTFVEIDGAPAQIIASADVGFQLKYRDLRHVPSSEQSIAVDNVLTEEAAAPLDLAQGPLIRGQLLRLGADDHILLLTQHHIITDAWSGDILLRELADLYRAFSNGRPDPLPPLQIQYADYAAWQRRWLTANVLERQTAFWKGYLADAPDVLNLPTDRPRPTVRNYIGSSYSLTLPRALTHRLRALSQRHGTTLFMTMLAAWGAFLGRISGQRDVVIGSPIANRQRSEVESIIGFFVNTLALRIRLDDDPTVGQLLARVKLDALQAYENQDLPFEQVVEAVQPVRSMSHSPLFQVILNWETVREANSNEAFSELNFSPVEQSYSMTQFDLTLFLKDIGDQIVGSWRYTIDLFDVETVARFDKNFQAMLTAMVDADDQRFSQLSLLSEPERLQVVQTFNQTAITAMDEQLIHRHFEMQASKRPDAIAVVCDGRRLSYDELNRRANQLAHYLIQQGVGPDRVVGIYAERSVEMLISLLAVLKSGGAYLPIETSLPVDRVVHMLSDSDACAVLTQSMLVNVLSVMSIPVVAVDVLPSNWPTEMMARNPDPRSLGLHARHLAYVIYTSGSTGVSKGVMVEHQSAVNFWQAMERTTHRHCSSDAIVALNASYSFDMSLKGILQLLSGRPLVLVPQHIRADGPAMLRFLEEHRVEVFDCTPSQLEILIAAGLLENKAYHPVSVLIGGEAIDLSLWQRLQRAPHIHFYNMYGPTECTVDATIGCINELGDRPTIGRPIANMEIHILDSHRQPVPIGVIGEIYVGGVGVARGYLKRPELTAERFLHLTLPGDKSLRMYQTGDLGRWNADGTITYLGRNDFQVKIRGFRIELGEIENKLIECAGVRDALVIARDDKKGEKRLVAYLLAQSCVSLSALELRGQLSKVLPEYMIPVAFVSLDAYPLTANGKVDRKALPAPDSAAVATNTFIAPVGTVEQTLAKIWQDLLEVEQVGREDSFFELGGHSLLGILLLSRLRQELDIEVPLRELFVHPTLQDFAAVVSAQEHFATFPNLVPIRAQGTVRPLFLVHPSEGEIGYARDLAPWLDPELPIYGLAATGFMQEEVPLSSIEEMAAQYLQQIRRVQPHGPYRIAGWSAGGTIAYEMAHQLIGADERVEFLGLFDTAGDYTALRQRLRGTTSMSTEVAFDQWIRSLEWLSTDATVDHRAEMEQLAGTGAVDALLSYGQRAGALPAEVDTDLLRRHLQLRHAMGLALVRYVRPSIPVKLSLFAASEDTASGRSAGWGNTTNLHIIPVPGTHFTMMEFPHIKTLAAAIEQEMRSTEANAIVPQEHSYSPAVTIQSGRQNQRPLFCVPGAGASVTAFAALAQALDPAIPIHGLQPRGLCGELVPHVDVQSAARVYLRAIRQIEPKGPYRLLGHSFGGWVAVEVARQLIAHGEQVEALIVLDSLAPSPNALSSKPYSRIEALMRLVGIYELAVNRNLSISVADFEVLDSDAQLKLLLSRLVEAKIVPRGTSLQSIRGIVRVFMTNMNTVYVPEGGYSGPLHLVVVPEPNQNENRPSPDVQEMISGWRRHAPKTEHWTGPGNHMTLLSSPHVDELAVWIRPLLKIPS